MASKEASVLSAILEHKDIHLILGEDLALFGGYSDGVGWVRDYYGRH